MTKHIVQISAILLSLNLHVVHAAGLPFYPEAAQTMTSDQQNLAGKSRVRVSISSKIKEVDGGIAVGNITVCTESACYRPTEARQEVSIFNTAEGKSTQVAEFSIPRETITSIYFDGAASTKNVSGDIKISNPLRFDLEYFGEDILVILKRSVDQQGTRYAPEVAVAAPFHPSRQAVYYDPDIVTTAKLPMGTTLSIPAQATARPQILSIAVHDTSGRFPLVDIYPEVALDPSASLTLTALDRDPSSKSAVVKNKETNSNAAITTSVKRTGVIRTLGAAKGPIGDSAVQVAGQLQPVTAAATDSCVAFLTSYKQDIAAALASTGSVYITACETIPPYVHLAVTNVLDSRELGDLYFHLGEPSSTAPGELVLSTLPSFYPTLGAQIVINGFSWTGDKGVGPGTGRANGFVQVNYGVLGTNIVGGGSSYYGTSDGNKVAFFQPNQAVTRWNEGTVTPLFTYDSSTVRNFFIVSSSTSVIKAGKCSGDGFVSRWSAIGSSKSGQMIFASSTSEGTTSAAELCTIYSALGADYAIRLDGSTATGMTIDGQLLNPITGANSVVFGPSRHIAYAIAMTSSQPGRTPIIEPRLVPPPSNPCSKTPRPPGCS